MRKVNYTRKASKGSKAKKVFLYAVSIVLLIIIFLLSFGLASHYLTGGAPIAPSQVDVAEFNKLQKENRELKETIEEQQSQIEELEAQLERYNESGVSPEPETTKKPSATSTPDSTKKPSATATPAASKKPSATASAKPTATPKPTATSKPTATPQPTTTPEREIPSGLAD